MQRLQVITLASAAVATATAMPVLAQDVTGDAQSPTVQWGRMMAEPGTFWLDSQDEVEVVRYTTPRDVSICLPEPSGAFASQEGHSLTISWDNQHSAIVRPGNCFFFDARVVKVKPTNALPPGVTLRGRVETEAALQRGNL